MEPLQGYPFLTLTRVDMETVRLDFTRHPGAGNWDVFALESGRIRLPVSEPKSNSTNVTRRNPPNENQRPF